MRKTKFKVFGERNTGTNWIAKLIEENVEIKQIGEDGKEGLVQGWQEGGWKHGKASQVSDDCLSICVIRNWNDWMCAMLYRPYHLDSYSELNLNIYDWFNRPLTVKKNEVALTGPQLFEDEGKLLMDIRYEKIKSYLALKEGVLVGYDWMLRSTSHQKEFVNKLCNDWRLILKSNEFISYDENANPLNPDKYYEKPDYPKLDPYKIEGIRRPLEQGFDLYGYKSFIKKR